jgi:hypothetical protein
MTHVINPLIDRAPGIIARFVTSETERQLGVQRNHFRDLPPRYAPNCYCIRYECNRCGLYVWFVKERPAEIPQACHHCGSKHVTIDGCAGWTNLPLPNLGQPQRLHQPLIPPQQKVTLVCEWCGREFTIPKRTKKQKCCSQKCGAQRHKHLKAAEGK